MTGKMDMNIRFADLACGRFASRIRASCSVTIPHGPCSVSGVITEVCAHVIQTVAVPSLGQ